MSRQLPTHRVSSALDSGRGLGDGPSPACDYALGYIRATLRHSTRAPSTELADDRRHAREMAATLDPDRDGIEHLWRFALWLVRRRRAAIESLAAELLARETLTVDKVGGHPPRMPHGWRTSGLWRFDDLWIALGEGPAFDDYASGSGQYAEQALRRLSGRLRERRGAQHG